MQRRLGLGLLLIVVGLFSLLATLGLLAWDWGRLWPLLFVFLGLLDLADHGWRGLRGGGGFLLLLGLFLLFFTTGLSPWPLQRAWPIGLILLGLLSLLGDQPNPAGAVFLIGGGAFLLALTAGKLTGGWSRYWPVILILAGLAAMVGRDGSGRKEEPPEPGAGEAEEDLTPDPFPQGKGSQ